MTIIDLIKLIKPIPELFIGIHNVFCLEAFINGWYYRDDKEDVRASVLYTEFYEWLQETEEKALDEFFVLFNIFYMEKYKTNLW